MSIRTAQFLAIVFLALYLVPVGAHLLEMPHKIGLDAPSYFAVQQIYRGWSLAGIVLAGGLLATLLLAILSSAQAAPRILAWAAFLLLLGAGIIFFVWVFPANQATENWTHRPDDWQALRAQWEYGHAAGAMVTLAAFLAAVASSLSWRGSPAPGERRMSTDVVRGGSS